MSEDNFDKTAAVKLLNQIMEAELAGVLAHQVVEDVSVEDPPLEQVIAEMFSLAGEQAARSEEEVAAVARERDAHVLPRRWDAA